MNADTATTPTTPQRGSAGLVGPMARHRCNECGAPASHQVTGYPNGPRFVCEQGVTVLRGVAGLALRRLTLADYAA